MVGEVKPEYLDQYKKLHRELHVGPYKELLKVIRDSGVKEEAVFMDGTRLILFYEAEDLDGAYRQQGGSDVAQRWNRLMAPMFASAYEFNRSDRLPVLEKVFDLAEQLAGELKP
jgi:L-rhamnose mutarotase